MSNYNAMVIDWICCPDCGCNVIRAEGITATGEPTGSIECTCCGFASLKLDPTVEHIYQDWEQICKRVGHEYHAIGYTANGEIEMLCVWCGKRVDV